MSATTSSIVSAVSTIVALAAYNKEASKTTADTRKSMSTDILCSIASATWDTERIRLACAALSEQLTKAGNKRVAPTVADFKVLCTNSGMIDTAAPSWSREAQRIRGEIRTSDEKREVLAIKIKEAKEALVEAIDGISSMEREYAILCGTARSATEELLDLEQVELSEQRQTLRAAA